jgi:hypothetical protein
MLNNDTLYFIEQNLKIAFRNDHIQVIKEKYGVRFVFTRVYDFGNVNLVWILNNYSDLDTLSNVQELTGSIIDHFNFTTEDFESKKFLELAKFYKEVKTFCETKDPFDQEAQCVMDDLKDLVEKYK